MKKVIKNSSYLSLLYVEDEELIRKNAIEFLNDDFKNIYEAKDGIEALQIYKDKKPDIVITDIKMPNMSGLELCHVIRKENSQIPIIITTAFTDKEYLLEAIELNLVKYITKPLNEESLIQALNMCIEKLENKYNSIERLTIKHHFDTLNQTLLQDDDFVKLTLQEKELLTLLINQKNRVVSYKEIENHVWSGEYMSDDAIKGLVKNLRKKTSKQSIENHSKLGYKIKLYNG